MWLLRCSELAHCDAVARVIRMVAKVSRAVVSSYVVGKVL